MEACRRCIACVPRTEFPRLSLRTVGKRRTAFLSRSIFAARSLLLSCVTEKPTTPKPCRGYHQERCILRLSGVNYRLAANSKIPGKANQHAMTIRLSSLGLA